MKLNEIYGVWSIPCQRCDEVEFGFFHAIWHDLRCWGPRITWNNLVTRFRFALELCEPITDADFESDGVTLKPGVQEIT